MKTKGVFVIDVDCLFNGALRARQQFNVFVLNHLFVLMKMRSKLGLSPQALPFIIYNSWPSDDNEKLKERILQAFCKALPGISRQWIQQQEIQFWQGRADNFSWLSLTELSADIVPEKVRVFAKSPVLFQSCQRQQLLATQAEKYGFCRHVSSDRPVKNKHRATVVVDLDDTALLRMPSLRFNVCEINTHVVSLCHFFQRQFEQCDFIVLTARACIRNAVLQSYNNLLDTLALRETGLTVSSNDNTLLANFVNLMHTLILIPLQPDGGHPALLELKQLLTTENIDMSVAKLALALYEQYPHANVLDVIITIKILIVQLTEVDNHISTQRIVEAMNENDIPLKVLPWSFTNQSDGRAARDKIEHITANLTNKDQAVIFIDDYDYEICAALTKGANHFKEGLHLFMCHSNLPLSRHEIYKHYHWLDSEGELSQAAFRTLLNPDNDGTQHNDDEMTGPKASAVRLT